MMMNMRATETRWCHLTLCIGFQKAVPRPSLIRMIPRRDVGIGVDIIVSAANSRNRMSVRTTSETQTKRYRHTRQYRPVLAQHLGHSQC